MLLGALAFFAPLIAWAVIFTNGWFQGFVVGMTVSTYVAMAIALFVAITGSANKIVGSWGEDNTRDILRLAKRRGRIAGWVDNIEVDWGDVDHLALLPDGRFIAIDSKWHAVSVTDDVVRRDVSDAVLNARRASLILRSLNLSTTVVPLVVCWGAARDELRGAPVYSTESRSSPAVT